LRYQPADHTAIVAASCAALATGCVDAVDPIAAYRNGLLGATPGGIRVARHGDPYELTVPQQRVAGPLAVVQTVTLDTASLLPRRIVWTQHGRVTAAIDVVRVRRVPDARVPPDAVAVRLPARVRLVRLDAAGGEHAIARTPVTPAEAAALRAPAY